LHVKVDRDIKHQVIFGFGGAFTDSTGINLKRIGPQLEDQILKGYYSEDGLEYNVGRIPMGGTDFSLSAYSLDDTEAKAEDKELKHFGLTSADLLYKVFLDN
jgi:glucosylceramidase